VFSFEGRMSNILGDLPKIRSALKGGPLKELTTKLLLFIFSGYTSPDLDLYSPLLNNVLLYV
jgi:hypothetical protein